MVEPVLPATARTLLARTARVQRDGRAPSLVAGVVRDGALAWSAGRGDVAEPHTDVQYRLRPEPRASPGRPAGETWPSRTPTSSPGSARSPRPSPPSW